MVPCSPVISALRQRGLRRAYPGAATGAPGSWRRAVRGTSPPGDATRRGHAESTSRRRAAPDYPGLDGSLLLVGAAVRPAGDAIPLRSTAPLSAPSA